MSSVVLQCLTDAITVSASPSQLRIRQGVDATFVCRIEGLQTFRRIDLRWTRLGGVSASIHYNGFGQQNIDELDFETNISVYFCQIFIVIVM